jgi:hypothetical protein
MEVSGKLHGPATLGQGKESHGTSLIGGWVGPRGILDTKEKKQTHAPAGYEAPIPRSSIP